jgi:predicted outer membrane repeat protein
VLTNVTITGNQAGNSGGGIYSDSSSPVLTHITITGNQAGNSGAGMYTSATDNSSPVLTNVILSGNEANSYGGGIYGDSSLIMINTLIAGNKAYGGGAVGFSGASSNVILTNTTIAGNTTNMTDVAVVDVNSASPKIRNSIIWGNSAEGIKHNMGLTTIDHSLVSGLTSGHGSWDQTGSKSGGGSDNNDADPGFVGAKSPSDAPTTEGDYRLLSTSSPAYNAGKNTLYPDTWDKWGELFDSPEDNPISQGVYEAYVQPALSKDAGGNPRLNDTIDMGAYEL